MSFCVSMPHFTNIGSRDCQDGGRCGAILNPVSDWVSYFLQNVNVYKHTKYRQDNSSRDITISVLRKLTSAILKFFFRFRLWPHHRKPNDILHEVAKLHPYRTTHCGNITSYRFLKMAAAAAQFSFRFHSCWCHCIRKVKIYQQTKFRRHISIHGWDITTSVLEKQTSATLELYFRFRCRLYHRNRHAILHQAAEFHSNRTIWCGNMTSYRIFKIEDATAQCYFRFPNCWYHCIRKVKVYQQTKFRRHILIHSWDITTSGLEKQKSAILEFYFRFRSRPFRRNVLVITYAEQCSSVFEGISDTDSRQRLRSASRHLLSVPRNRRTFGRRTFAVAGPTAWNSLTIYEICLSCCDSYFGCFLKYILFSFY